MSNTRGVAVYDTYVTRTPRTLYIIGVLGMSTATGACSLPQTRTNLTNKPLQSTPTPSLELNCSVTELN